MIARLGAAPARIRLLFFAFGDFAFNLYWQSIMLFLLFYYTEALGLPVATAAAIYTVASVWDGLANFLAGAVADRREPGRGYGRFLMLGSVPLGLAFVLTYLPPLATGWWGLATVFLGHLLFRTAYAAVNVPYLAMSARVSSDSRDRAFLAGMRMVFGTMAAVLVARGTLPFGAWIAGSTVPAQAYLGAAILFAVLGTGILMLVGASYREQVVPVRAQPPSIAASLRSLAANRAFVTLNLAMMAMIVAVTILNKSVLYYFKYFVGDAVAGQSALAWMGVVGAAAVPLWMLLQRLLGTRSLWFLAAAFCMAGLLLFSSIHIDKAGPMQLFLVTMQAVIVGLHFAYWAMLPNTVEYGEKTTGLRVEGAVFGMAALLQRIAIGVATLLLAAGFDSAGFVANVRQSEATLATMRFTIALVPLAFLALSVVLMWLNPLGRGEHAKIVRDLEDRAS
ncbi:GPH family glycoside/pentoside/hexuronide:cation symporter [Sphingomonas kyeonggiensis]|uniref:GPH family glycoside/pentoside/hexuronide:cation symporter n=1 Tax=Sphingomonas kyeonggiensis TaxID=1268553 RepID=A0A7W7K430_9SPHN|nr:glycoside-pentoside-hexuronide (GPH):cation symporter [Sphingomonas kyeonggiensis]MBB4840669.1 GPH family glycoside/pentoside/hexuronide:cation symporter [Sphingomonas kyeonggiensis]